MVRNSDMHEICELMPLRFRKSLQNALLCHQHINEIRMRKNRPLVLCGADFTAFLHDDGSVDTYARQAVITGAEEVDAVFSKLCHYSVYTYQESLNACYLTLQNGGRVGICASAVLKDGSVAALKDIASLNFRIARQMPTCAGEVLKKMHACAFPSIIIIGAPCSGKTTLLRELCRSLSSGYGGHYRKCVLADERAELAAMHQGVPRFDVGINTDVLTFFPKKEAILNAVRVMSPEWIIADEIGSVQECQSVLQGFNSGVKFIVSMHASNGKEARKKTLFRLLVQSGCFGAYVTLGSGENLGKLMEFETLEGERMP